MMPSHQETRRLPHSAAEMYDLVADMERYPEFLPWCAAARIRARHQDDGPRKVMDVDIVAAFKVFRESFGTRVTLDPEARVIDSRLLDGPFRHLHSRWAFRDLGEAGCEVDYGIEFEFRNPVLRRVMNSVFGDAQTRIMQAFEKRADSLYGRRG